MNAVQLVVPEGIDDPSRISGGNRYDREAADELRRLGWAVTEHAASGGWPRPSASALNALAHTLDALPDGELVVVDGLIASGAAPVLVPRSERLRLVVLLHMIFGGDAVPEDDELAVLARARAVVTTSAWTRSRLLDRYALPPHRLYVCRPGARPRPVSPPSADGSRLLCIGALAAHKGQDLLVDALARSAGLSWSCTLVGPLDRDPPFVASLERRATAAGIADRLRLPGARTGAALALEYCNADVLVVPSRAETYGMVVTEALAAGLPVIATEVGGVPEALGATPTGTPGLLVPLDDSRALAAALTRWLTDVDLRSRLRRAALRRRDRLLDWRTTGRGISTVLSSVRAEPDPREFRGPE